MWGSHVWEIFLALRTQEALLSPLRALGRFLAAELGMVAVAFVISGPNPKSTKKKSSEKKHENPACCWYTLTYFSKRAALLRMNS